MSSWVGVVKSIISHQRQDSRVIEVSNSRKTPGINEQVHRQLPHISHRDTGLQQHTTQSMDNSQILKCIPLFSPCLHRAERHQGTFPPTLQKEKFLPKNSTIYSLVPPSTLPPHQNNLSKNGSLTMLGMSTLQTSFKLQCSNFPCWAVSISSLDYVNYITE